MPKKSGVVPPDFDANTARREGRLWEGAESREAMIAREEREGLRRPPIRLSQTRDLIEVQERTVTSILRDTARSAGPATSMDGQPCILVPLSDYIDMAGAEIGKPLPWPRKTRDALLAASDWTQMADRQAAMSPRQKAAWADYRQALRDLPEMQPDPAAVNWPAKPG